MSQIHQRGPNGWTSRAPGADVYAAAAARPAGSPRVWNDRGFARSQERFSPAPRFAATAPGSASPVPSVRRGYPHLLSPSMTSLSQDKSPKQQSRIPTPRTTKKASPVFQITQLPYVQDRDGSVDNSGGSSSDSHGEARGGASKSGTDDTLFDSIGDGVDQYEDASESSHMTTPDARDHDAETFEESYKTNGGGGKHGRSRSGASTTGSEYSASHRELGNSVDVESEGDESEPETLPAPVIAKAASPPGGRQQSLERPVKSHKRQSLIKSAQDSQTAMTSPGRSAHRALHSFSPLGQTIEKQRRLVETQTIEMQRRIVDGSDRSRSTDAIPQLVNKADGFSGIPRASPNLRARASTADGPGAAPSRFGGARLAASRTESSGLTDDPRISSFAAREQPKRTISQGSAGSGGAINRAPSTKRSAPSPIDIHQASKEIPLSNGLGLSTTSSTDNRRESITFPALRQAWKEREQISASQNDLTPRERLKRTSGYSPTSTSHAGAAATAMTASTSTATAMTTSTSTSSMATAQSKMSFSSSSDSISRRPQRELMPPPSASDHLLVGSNSSAMGSTPYLSAASNSDVSDDGGHKPWSDSSPRREWGGSSASLPRHPALQSMATSSDDADRRSHFSGRSGIAAGSSAATPIAQPKRLGSSGGASGRSADAKDWSAHAAPVNDDGLEPGQQSDGYGGIVMGPGSFLVSRDRTQSQTSDTRSFVTAGGQSFRGPTDLELPHSGSFVMVQSNSAVSDTEDDDNDVAAAANDSRKYPPPSRGNATPRKGRSRSGSISGIVGVFKGFGSKVTGSLGKKSGKAKDEPRSAAAVFAAEQQEAFGAREREASAPATLEQQSSYDARTAPTTVDSTTSHQNSYAASQRSRRPSMQTARRPGSASSSHAPSVRPSLSMPNIAREGDRHRSRKNRASIISAHASQAAAAVSSQAPSRAVSPARTQLVRAAMKGQKQAEAVVRAANAEDYGEINDYSRVDIKSKTNGGSAAADFFNSMDIPQPATAEELEALSPVEQYVALAAQFAEGGGKALVQKLANEGVRLQREQRARELEVEKMQEKITALLPDNLDRQAVHELHLSMATRVPKGFKPGRKTAELEDSKERVARLDERLSALETEIARQKVRLGRIAKERPALSRKLAAEKARFEEMRDIELRLRRLRPAAFKQAMEAQDKADDDGDDDEHLLEMHDEEDGIQAPGSGRAIVYGDEIECVRKLRSAVLTQKVALSMLKTHETSCYSQLLIAEEALRSCIALAREMAELLEELVNSAPAEQSTKGKNRLSITSSSRSKPQYPSNSRASIESGRYYPPSSASSSGRRGSRSGMSDMAVDEALGEEAEEQCERVVYLRRKIEARAFQVEEIVRAVQTAYAKAERLANRRPGGGSGQQSPSDANGKQRQRQRLTGAQSETDIRSVASQSRASIDTARASSSIGNTLAHLVRLLPVLRILSVPHTTPTQLRRSTYKLQQWAARARASLPQLHDAREMLDDVIVDAEETSERLAEDCVTRMAQADDARTKFYTTSARVLIEKWGGGFGLGEDE